MTPRYRNILLIYPEVPANTYWSFKYALKFIRKKSSMPPLGLLTIAALFPDTYNLKLVDMNVADLSDADIKWADAVFISAMIVQKDSMKAVIRRCRAFDKTIVAGGPYPTGSYREIDDVDHFLTGEVDETFPQFLTELEAGTAKAVYPRPPHPDITRRPSPRFDLLDLSVYGSMAVQYSRGCPFHCEFCDIWAVYGNRPRLKSPESLLAELDTLYRLGWEGAVFVVDDNFIGNKKRVKSELLPALVQWQKRHGHPFHFFTEASINLGEDEELLSAMREAGFNEVFIGIETPNVEGLAETGKTQNLKADMKKSIRTIQRHGIEVMAGFIVGFDNDGSDIFNRQISFIQENGIPKAMIGLLTALPGTRLYQRLKAEGRILNTSIGNNTHNLTTNFKTVMDPERLKEGYKKILSNLYDFTMKNYFKRCSRLLDAIEHTEHFQRKIRWKEVRAFFTSIFRQPFTPYGLQYIKFVLRNLILHRDVFAEVITLSITGHHFHTITRETIKKERIASILDAQYRHFCDLVNEYSEALKNNSQKSLRYAAKLWKKRIRILKRMNHHINRLHVEFRQDLSRKYIDISYQMRDMLTKFEARAIAQSTAAP